MSCFTYALRIPVLTLVAVAILAPPAAGGHEDFGHEIALQQIRNDQPVVRTSANGFDWGDAGVGAATSTLGVLVAGITLAGLRHSRRRHFGSE